MILKFSITYFIFFSTIATVVPYLQQILKIQGFKSYEIGLLLAVYEMTGVLGPLLIGWLADRLGRYRLVLLSITAGSAIFFLLLTMNTVFMITALVLAGFGLMYRPVPPMTDALASRFLTESVDQYGMARIWGSIGFVLISLFYQLWGFLDVNSAERVAAVFTGLAGLLFISFLTLPEIKKSGGSPAGKDSGLPNLIEVSAGDGSLSGEVSFHTCPSGEDIPDNVVNGQILNPGVSGNSPARHRKLTEILPPPFWIGISAAFIIKFSMSGYYSFFSIYLNEVYGIQGISGIWGLGALAEIPVILWGGRIVTGLGYSRALGLSAAGTVLRMLIYSFGVPAPVMIAAQLLHALSFGLFHITSILLINEYVQKDSRAIAMAVFGGISLGLAGVVGNIINGFILESRGFYFMYLFCGISAAAALPFIFLKRKLFSSGAAGRTDNR